MKYLRNFLQFIIVNDIFVLEVFQKLYLPVMNDLATSITNQDETASERCSLLYWSVLQLNFTSFWLSSGCFSPSKMNFLKLFFCCWHFSQSYRWRRSGTTPFSMAYHVWVNYWVLSPGVEHKCTITSRRRGFYGFCAVSYKSNPRQLFLNIL